MLGAEKDAGFLDVAGADFEKAFPSCAPGVLRQEHSSAELAERARNLIRADAKSVQSQLDVQDAGMINCAVERCIDRLFGKRVIEKFDPSIAPIDAFRWGVMKKVMLELLRENSKRRMDLQKAERLAAGRSSTVIDPAAIAESKDLLAKVRAHMQSLPVAQRNAIARRFEAVADLDDGAPVKNEYVARHRGLLRLRRLLTERTIVQ